jgi:hypothetical protein
MTEEVLDALVEAVAYIAVIMAETGDYERGTLHLEKLQAVIDREE